MMKKHVAPLLTNHLGSSLDDTTFDDFEGGEVPQEYFRQPIDRRNYTTEAIDVWVRKIQSDSDWSRLKVLIANFRSAWMKGEGKELADVATKAVCAAAAKLPGRERIFMLALSQLFGIGLGTTQRKSLFSEGGVRLLESRNRINQEIDRDEAQLILLEAMASRALMMSGGADLWERTYKLGKGDEGAFEEAGGIAGLWTAENILSTDLAAYSFNDPEMGRQRLTAHYAFLALWADQAFPILQTSHTYAAALACTDVPIEAVLGLHAPWRALRVELPVDLIMIRTGEMQKPVAHVDLFVTTYLTGAAALMGYQKDGRRVFFLEAPTLSELLSTSGDADELDIIGRVSDACRRIVAGLILAMSGGSGSYKERFVKGRMNTPRERGEPGHRRVVVGSPISVDARPALERFLSGEPMGKARKASGVGALQWLVRGFFRSQRHGKGRALSKTIWIEPHWAGRADAEIIVRPKMIRGS